MKKIILILFICIIAAIVYGFYKKNTGEELTGDRIIGISVLATAFVFMPLFIYHNAKGKKMKDYMLTEENLKKMRKKNDSESEKK